MHGTIMVFLAIVPLAFARLRQLRRAAADRRAGHGVSRASTWPATNAYVLGGRDHVRQLLHPGRRGAGRLDLLFAAGDCRFPTRRPNLLADRHGVPDYLLAAGRGELHRHHHSVARAGHDLDAAAVLCLGAVCDRVSAAAGVSAAGSRGRHAADGQGCCTRAFSCRPAWRSAASWRTSAAAAARCCGSTCSGSWPSGSLRPDSAGDGHRRAKSSPTTRASRSGVTNRWSIRCWPSVSCPSSSGRTTCI